MGVVDVGVGIVRGEEGVDEGDFGGVFGEVGLDWEVLFLGESAEAGEEGGRAGGDEAGCYDWGYESVRWIDC